MLTSPTTPCIASGWLSSKALWIAKASTSMTEGSSTASLNSPTLLSTNSRLAATSRTFIWRPSASGSRIWKSSSTLAISNGTCCSASQRMTSRASASFIRSIWIFLTITSRPPTAVTPDFRFTPAASNRPRIASETRPGSMTSPSTMASAATSVVATLVSSASLPPWSMTTSLMIPEPISRPTEVFLPPNNPKRAMCTFWRRDKKGRGQTTIGPAPYPVKPRIDLRLKQQLFWLLLLRPLLVELNPPTLPHHRDGARALQSRQDTAARVVKRCLTTQALNRQVGVLGHHAAPKMRIRVAATGRLQVTLDDGDAVELVRALDAQSTVHQQDTLALVAIECGVTGNVDDREVRTAVRGRIQPIAPVREVGLVADAAVELGVCLVVPRPECYGRARRHLSVSRPFERGERVVVDARVVHYGRIPLHRAVTGRTDVGAGIADARLGRAWRVAVRPAIGVLVSAVDVGVTGQVDAALRRQGRMDPEVDWRDARDQADALPRPTAARHGTGGACAVAARDVDEEDVRAELVAEPAVAARAVWRRRIRDGDGVERIQLPLVHRVGYPAHDALLRTRLSDAEGLLYAALVLAYALLLGAGEERSRDQGSDDYEGEDRHCERHTAFVTQDPTHTLLLFECSEGSPF